MKFYLGDRTNEVEVLVRPELTRHKDDTYDSMTVVLKANNRAKPYPARINFIIDMETTPSEVLCFVVESDIVSLFSTSPMLYKHTLSLIEKKKVLQFHHVRNSSFAIDPGNYQKQIFCSIASSIENGAVRTEEGVKYITYAAIADSWQNPSIKRLSGGLTNATAYITLQGNFFYVVGSTSEEYTLSSCNDDFDNIYEVNQFFSDLLQSNLQPPISFIIKYTDANNVQHTVTKDLSQISNIDTSFNSKYFNIRSKSDYLTDLLNQGCKDIEITFATSGAYGSNVETMYAPGHPTIPCLLGYNAMVQVDLEYNQSDKNCYEILDLLVKRQRKDTSITESENTNLFNLPDNTHYPELKTLLENTPAPTFSFTQATMYECVAEVFRLFDATFTIDEDNYINIDYFNEKTREINIDNQVIGINQTITSDKFSTNVISYYQDARTLEVFPGPNQYCVPRSMKLGVPDLADHVILLPHNIHQIKKVVWKLYGVVLDTGSTNLGKKYFPCNIPLDITDWVVESSIWSGLSTASNFEWNKKKQNNTVSYSKGSNTISLGHTYNDERNKTYYSIRNVVISAFKSMMGAPDAALDEYGDSTSPDTWYSQSFRVEYYTSVDGKLKVESLQRKYDGDLLVDQNNGSVDLNKMGTNMLGVAMKTGEPNKNVSITLRSWADRIEEGAYTNDGYVVNVVKYTFLNDGKIKEQIEFVKNFNALSQRVKMLEEKRLSNIASELITKSEDILTNYVYFSLNNFNSYPSQTGKNYFSNDVFANFLHDSFVAAETQSVVGFATITSDELVASMNENVNTPYSKSYNAVYIPLLKYGAGNSICFEMNFDHPINAGNYTLHNITGWWETSTYFTGASFYTDKNGQFEKCSIKLYGNANFKFDEFFPNVNMYFLTPKASIDNYKVYKQSNEIFALNFELTFLPMNPQSEFLGNDFINKNAFIGYFGETFYIYFSTEKFDILDRKVSNITNAYKRLITPTVTNDGQGRFNLTLSFSSFTPNETIKGWAIGDSKGNIYFAFNEDITSSVSSKTIYFYTSGSKRIDPKYE